MKRVRVARSIAKNRPRELGELWKRDHEGFISLHKYWLQTLSPVTTQKADMPADWLGKSFWGVDQVTLVIGID